MIESRHVANYCKQHHNEGDRFGCHDSGFGIGTCDMVEAVIMVFEVTQ